MDEEKLFKRMQAKKKGLCLVTMVMRSMGQLPNYMFPDIKTKNVLIRRQNVWIKSMVASRVSSKQMKNLGQQMDH